jgi:ketosteroid isomerase-like protein
VFESKQALVDGAFGPLLDRLAGGLTTTFREVAADGDRVFLRFESEGITKSGIRYEQVYCWAMTMRDGRIIDIVACLDTELLEPPWVHRRLGSLSTAVWLGSSFRR